MEFGSPIGKFCHVPHCEVSCTPISHTPHTSPISHIPEQKFVSCLFSHSILNTSCDRQNMCRRPLFRLYTQRFGAEHINTSAKEFPKILPRHSQAMFRKIVCGQNYEFLEPESSTFKGWGPGIREDRQTSIFGGPKSIASGALLLPGPRINVLSCLTPIAVREQGMR